MTPEPDEISICDNCGREFPFPTGVAVDDDKHGVLFLCPECYNREKQIELIKEWRAESEKNWVPLTTPDTANYIYAKCADQLEKLVGESPTKQRRG